jgi:xanthine dehydrogenase accessory factor
VKCFDTRDSILGKSIHDYELDHPLVNFYFKENLLDCIPTAPKESYFLVMTHSHQLDFLICQKILQNNSFEFLGLIGSKTKSARFTKRLLDSGLDKEVVNRLICPIGKKYQFSKSPAVIAIEIISKLLEVQENQNMRMNPQNFLESNSLVSE